MDVKSLELLAANGFSGISGDQLGDLAVWCRDYAEASGDARFSSIGEALFSLDEWWSEHDERGGIPVRLKDEIEDVLTSRLPDILSATSPSDAAPLARLLREEVQSKLIGPQEWVLEGYADRNS